MSSEIIWKYEKPNYEILLEKLEKLQKENEELKAINSMQKYRIEVIDERELISKEKVDRKIKEYKDMLKTLNKKSDIDRIKAINERIIGYKELLGGEND